MQPYPFAILNDQVYQLVEDEDTEAWKLHVTRLEPGDQSPDSRQDTSHSNPK
jgi:hypothetical protein